MGGPGCGKGTQCKNMATKYGFCHVGLGQLLRQEAQRSTQRGRKIHNIMLQGLLVPMGIILDMICNAMLSRPESRGFLIDGFLRELRQAKEFERIRFNSIFYGWLNMKDPNFERKKHETHRMSERVRAQHRPGCDLQATHSKGSPSTPTAAIALSPNT
ncbi:adenylate kinase isoenzyme 1 isoform X1 [Callorhinus ursinus]|uniref:adenylate kinase isoenzyme 1 isoform X1 n=1 Tax=Callorhinus ursinus TaxID=34884 RepID=UPI003CD010CA